MALHPPHHLLHNAIVPHIATAMLLFSLAACTDTRVRPGSTGSAALTPSPTVVGTFPSAGPIKMCGIENFAWTIEGVLARSAQPPPVAWQCLKDHGFTTVVRQNPEGDDGDEGRAVAALGMEYIDAYGIPDQTAYAPDLLEGMMRDVVRRLLRGERILVHDAGGRGRLGFWEATFLMWDGWSSRAAIDRFVAFGWKIECERGGNGQMQGINEVAAALGQPPYHPQHDRWGTPWAGCPRPVYMAGWDYGAIRWPAGGGGGWSRTGIIPGHQG